MMTGCRIILRHWKSTTSSTFGERVQVLSSMASYKWVTNRAAGREDSGNKVRAPFLAQLSSIRKIDTDFLYKYFIWIRYWTCIMKSFYKGKISFYFSSLVCLLFWFCLLEVLCCRSCLFCMLLLDCRISSYIFTKTKYNIICNLL